MDIDKIPVSELIEDYLAAARDKNMAQLSIEGKWERIDDIPVELVLDTSVDEMDIIKAELEKRGIPVPVPGV